MTESTQDNSSAVETTTTENQVETESTTNILGSETPQPEPEAAPTQQEIDGFVSTLTEDLKSEKSLQSFKDVNSLAKSYVELNKAFGKRVTDLTGDELNEYYAKLGRPESPDQYEIAATGEDDTIAPEMAKIAFENGISKDAMKNLSEAYSEMINEHVKLQESQQLQAQEESIKAIKQEFGSAFESRVKLANDAIREFGGQELIDTINKHNLGNEPALVKAFSEIGKLIAEDKPVGKQDIAKFGMTPSEAANKIANLYADDAFLTRWKDQSHPGHAEAVKQIESLYKIKSGMKA